MKQYEENNEIAILMGKKRFGKGLEKFASRRLLGFISLGVIYV